MILERFRRWLSFWIYPTRGYAAAIQITIKGLGSDQKFTMPVKFKDGDKVEVSVDVHDPHVWSGLYKSAERYQQESL